MQISGCGNVEVHAMAWETFEDATEMAKKLKLYGARARTFWRTSSSGNICVMGPIRLQNWKDLFGKFWQTAIRGSKFIFLVHEQHLYYRRKTCRMLENDR